jgi:hypothetical protein
MPQYGSFPFGEEILKLFAQRCPHHYFGGWARQLVAPIGGSKMLARRSAAAEASAALFLGAVSPRAF